MYFAPALLVTSSSASRRTAASKNTGVNLGSSKALRGSVLRLNNSR